MGDSDPRHLDRRTVLGRGAAVAVGVWTVPVIQSFASPAAAASGPPAVAGCRTQSFTIDRYGGSLTFLPGTNRFFDVDLHATFTLMTMIQVRLIESAADPLQAEDRIGIGFRDLGPIATGFNGLNFGGVVPPPSIIDFHVFPGGTYESRLRDGKVELFLFSQGTFTLTRIEIEVCGTIA